MTTLPDILSQTAEKHSQNLEGAPEDAAKTTAAPLAASLAKALRRPGSPPHQGCAGAPRDSLPAAALGSAEERRARLPASPRRARGQLRAEGRLRWRLPSGSLLLLFPAGLILLLPSARQADFWRPRPRGDAACSRGGRRCAWGCVHTCTYIYLYYVYGCACVSD